MGWREKLGKYGLKPPPQTEIPDYITGPQNSEKPLATITSYEHMVSQKSQSLLRRQGLAARVPIQKARGCGKNSVRAAIATQNPDDRHASWPVTYDRGRLQVHVSSPLWILSKNASLYRFSNQYSDGF